MGIDQSYGKQLYHLSDLVGLRFHKVTAKTSSINIDLCLIMYE